MYVYKIQHKITKLFSTGGCSPRWKKNGKIWSEKRHLNNHFNCMMRNRNVYKDAIIICYLLEPTCSFDAEQFRIEAENRENLREKEYQDWANKQKIERRRREYEELKKEFES